MTLCLAIDPGKDCLGWALGRGHTLLGYGISRRLKGFAGGLGQLADLHAKAVRREMPSPPSLVVVELMQSYTFADQKGDQNDLIELSTIGAQVAGQWADAQHIYVRPSQWKGQTPKDISASRTEKELARRGCLDRLDLKPFPKGLRHNVYDAIGIWIYATKDFV